MIRLSLFLEEEAEAERFTNGIFMYLCPSKLPLLLWMRLLWSRKGWTRGHTRIVREQNRKCLNGITRFFDCKRQFYDSWPLRILCAETCVALLCNGFRSWKYFKRVYCYVNQMLKIAIRTENVPIFSPLEEYWSSKFWWLVRGSHEHWASSLDIATLQNPNLFHSFKISPWL